MILKPDLEARFHEAMLDIYQQGKAIGYHANDFKRMVIGLGGLETARRLLLPGKIHDGFLKLLELNALHISVEALVLDERWPEGMFTKDELKEARKRLGR